MRKIRQFCALLLAGIALCSSITACDTLPQGTSSSSFSSFTDSEDSSSLGGHYQDRDDDSSSWNGSSSTDSSSWNDSSSDSADSSYDSSSSADDADDLKEQQEIVDMAYALNKGDYLGGTYSLTGTITKIDDDYRFSIEIAIKGRESKPIYCYNLQGDDVSKLRIGDEATVCGRLKNYNGLIEFDSGCILEDYRSDLPDGSGDPYVSVVKSEFYENYTPAANAADAYYRTQHGLLSGNNVVPDQAPTLSAYQPKASDGSFIRNSDMRYDDDEENTYVVVDAYGNEAFRVYRYGAYITLEEVAAFVYAFGTYPANYTTSKNTKPTSSVWGEYLRLNHTAFSGDTSAYPYEPILPNISGCGGDLHYYEMDIGTTGTDCDPSYPSKLYNNGSTITRGAARIVYGKEDLNGNGVYERGEFHIFYTYNHYNDFQEYLNYQGGWGEKFGNITGGGTISSKKDYNPTDYVEVTLAPLVTTLLLRMPIYAQTANAYYAF